MAKEYKLRVRGRQREQIDADLMTHLVVMMGRQLAAEDEQKVERSAEEPPRQEDAC